MTFLILGLLGGTLIGFFTATLLVCAARSQREEALQPTVGAEPVASREALDGRRAAVHARA